MKRQKLQTTTATLNAPLHGTAPNRHLQYLSQFQQTVARVLSEPPQQILAHLVKLQPHQMLLYTLAQSGHP